ncbi:MAG TPA: aromatic ring-hydroxylating dioxygenase subunit alpha [Chloroflexota bacterium]|nr:aromatic ring-hydroxylating dioxygenase subunit alpha [Chloroflexota bacterium]
MVDVLERSVDSSSFPLGESLGFDPVLEHEWHVVGRSEDVTDRPVPVLLLGEKIVLWRAAGEIHAARDLCLHRGTRLSIGRVEGDKLVCAYHGWRYNGAGRCAFIPAQPDRKPPDKAQLRMYHAAERYGWIWVCLGEPGGDVPHIPEWDDPTYQHVMCGPYEVAAEAPRLVENFLDVTHFPYVHEGYLGDPDHAALGDYTAELTPEGIVTSEIEVWQPDPDGTGVGKSVSYIYKVFRPLVGYFSKVAGGRFSIFFTVTPVDRRRSVAWMYVCLDYGGMPDEEVRAFQDTIFTQDLDIVLNQHPEELPLNLADELSLRSDRTSIAYRKWLRSLGMTFGTC